jgi:NADH dehydrogenase [ubiquinone] 1 alpha subcomplex assembly factor 1
LSIWEANIKYPAQLKNSTNFKGKMTRKIPSIKILFILISIWLISNLGFAGATEEMKDLEHMILDFSSAEDKTSWQIVNDGVMGGISQSEIFFKESGVLIFRGTVSLENNGGFASSRRSAKSYNLGGYSGMLLQVRGDGKDYQLRVRTDDRFDGISYRYHFKTQAGTTQIIKALFADFEPAFRGRIIKDAVPLSAEKIQQIGFLIGDKQAGQFSIEIDWIKGFK